MTDEERARLVVALDHDARQPQHSGEMGLRALRLIAADLKARRFDEKTLDLLLHRMTAELACVQSALRQIVDAQQDLVDAIRLDFDKTKPVLRSIRVDDLIERVLKCNRGLANNVRLRGVASRLAVVTDERWVERILNNLIANAILHSDGDKVLFSARRRGIDVLFEVRDNGRGIAPDKVAKFLQSINVPTMSPVGHSTARSGLGLYNVRLFVARLGGSIDCLSVPGRGTCFRVRLPGPVSFVERYRRVASRSTAQGAQNKMIAVLDDKFSPLRAAERLFEEVGIEIYADHDPLRWLNVVTDLRRMPDLFLMDFQLRGQDCSLQLDIVKRKWGDQKPKIIVLAGHSRNGNVLKISQTVPVLLKPLSDRGLEFVLGVLAGQHELPPAGFLHDHV